MISPQIKKLNARMFLHGIVNRISGYGRYISHIEQISGDQNSSYLVFFCVFHHVQKCL